MTTDWSRLLDEARADDLAQVRVRERWLRQQATESATLVGTLLDLAEAGTAITVTVVGGRRHEGRIVAIGHDVVVLADRDALVAVRTDAVAVVRPQPGQVTGVATGDRPAALDLRFAELLGTVAVGIEVAIGLVTGDVVAGELLASGADVATVRVAPGPDGIVYCSAPSLTSARFRSG